ncbi:MAG: DUF6371 domain-containing protein [Candidatus Amoebophilus sp.]
MRKDYSYQLEPYRGPATRYTCPRCDKHRQFVRYIHVITKEPLAHHVGRCNREQKCAYHYTPGQFLADHKIISPRGTPSKLHAPVKSISKATCYIPMSLLKESLKNYELNHFVSYLKSLLGTYKTEQLIAKFYIGTSKHWPGATVFWQIDHKGGVRTGKIMLYDSHQGTRIKVPFNHISWVHQALKLDPFHLSQSLFGAHQLLQAPLKQPVALVESEKTAIIATAYWPGFIWMSVGSLNGLTLERCAPLQGRKVFLFPDAGAYELWKQKAEELSQPLKIKLKVSNWIEKHVSPQGLEYGADLADYLSQILYPG